MEQRLRRLEDTVARLQERDDKREDERRREKLAVVDRTLPIATPDDEFWSALAC